MKANHLLRIMYFYSGGCQREDPNNFSSSIMMNTRLSFKKLFLTFTLNIDGDHPNNAVYKNPTGDRVVALMTLEPFLPKTYLFIWVIKGLQMA